MRETNKIAIIVMMLLFLTNNSVFAAVLSEKFLKESIVKDLQSKLAKVTTAETTINILQMPYKTITVEEGKVAVSADINFDYFTTRAIAKVNVSVNGVTQRYFGVPVEIKVQDSVWVAKETIRSGASITSNNLKLEKRDIGSCLKFAANENFDFSRYLAKKTFTTDEIIDKRFIESVPDVMRNNVVTVIFSTDFLNMTIDAESMEDGKIGDYIQVRSKKYRKYYKGQIIDTNQVLVKI